MKRKIAFAVVLVLLTGTVWAQRAAERPDEAVLLIDMAYSDGRWQAKPAALLPCGGPSKPDSISATRSMYQLRSREGKVLIQRYIENPRIILVEDPKELPPLLRQMKFKLRIPIRQQGKTSVALREIQVFEFFENGRQQREPSAVAQIDLSALSASTAEVNGKRSPCGVIDPSRDKLPALTMKPGDAISPETLVALVRKDRGALIRWGLENDVTPDDLRKLIARDEKRLAQLNLDRRTIDALIREYEAAYRNRKP